MPQRFKVDCVLRMPKSNRGLCARFKLGLAGAMPKAYTQQIFVGEWCGFYITQYLDVHEISKQLCISERTVRRYIHPFEQIGDIKPVSQRHGPHRLLGEFEQLMLLRLVLDKPGIYLHEVQSEWVGVDVSISTLCKTLRHMGCTMQVMQHVVALQQI